MPSPTRLARDSYPAIAFGVDLHLSSRAEVGGLGRGHGTVIWRADILMPSAEHDEQRFPQWLADPAAPLGSRA